MKKICVVTGSRAEYGLLFWLMKEIDQANDLKLQIIVTGMHLSTEHGLTYREIEKEFKIDKKVDMQISADTAQAITKSTGLGVIGFADAYSELEPNLVILLGDRYEIFAAASSAMLFGIPIAHIHGGETTEGVFDEAIRHSITKMSHLHFTAAPEYRKRVIQLGEHPDRVFNVGPMAVENIKRLKLLSKNGLEKALDFKFDKKNILLTFHPATLENNSAKKQFEQILAALDELENTSIIFTKANSDMESRIINSMIDEYTAENSHQAKAFEHLGQVRYLSAVKHCDIVMGNSSSGIIEAPLLNTPTINIGNRQKGRLRTTSIIDCRPVKENILAAVEKVYSREFKEQVTTLITAKDKMPSEKIVETIRKTDLGSILKKSFYDLGVAQRAPLFRNRFR